MGGIDVQEAAPKDPTKTLGDFMPGDSGAVELKTKAEYEKKVNKGQSYDEAKERADKQGYNVVQRNKNPKVFAALEAEVEDSIKPWSWEAGAQVNRTGEQRNAGNVVMVSDYRLIMGRTPGTYIYLQTPERKLYPPVEEYADANLKDYEAVDISKAIQLVKKGQGRMSGDPRMALLDRTVFKPDDVKDLPEGSVIMLIADNNDRDEKKQPKIKLFVGELKKDTDS